MPFYNNSTFTVEKLHWKVRYSVFYMYSTNMQKLSEIMTKEYFKWKYSNDSTTSETEVVPQQNERKRARGNTNLTNNHTNHRYSRSTFSQLVPIVRQSPSVVLSLRGTPLQAAFAWRCCTKRRWDRDSRSTCGTSRFVGKHTLHYQEWCRSLRSALDPSTSLHAATRWAVQIRRESNISMAIQYLFTAGKYKTKMISDW